MSEIYDNLTILGVKNTVAKVIEVLADNESHSMREIERAADLRQSEVSVAVGEISEYLEVSGAPSAKGNKPLKVVKMNKMMYRDYVNTVHNGHSIKYSTRTAARNKLLKV